MTAWRFSARVMGTKSPIFDIEHLQLFDKSTSSALLRNAGFNAINVTSVRNKYPVDYGLASCFLFPGPKSQPRGGWYRLRA